MSDYQGNIIIKNPATPTGPFENGAAPGVWKLSDVLPFVRQGIWPTQGIQGKDPFFPYVSLLLSTTSLGNANNNLFVDSSGAFNPVSRFGNATQGSFTPYATNWSNYTSGGYLSWTNSTGLGSNNFTIEFWGLNIAGSGNWGVFSIGATSGIDYAGITMAQDAGVYISTTGSSWQYTGIGGLTFSSDGRWHHYAIVRNGGSLLTFKDGTLIATTAITGSLVNNSGHCRVASKSDATGTMTGYISNFRVVNGTALYTASFTVPTAPLTAVTNTAILTCQSNRFRDASSNNFALTVNGSISVTDFGPFSPTYPGASYNQSDITNWSGFFNGGTDRVQVPVTSNMYLGTTYTIEAWAYYNSTSYGARPIFSECEPFQGGFAGLTLTLNTSGSLVAEYRPATSGPVTTITGPTVTPYTWFHIALVSDNSSAKLYVNGTQVGSTTTFGDYPSAKTAFVAVGSWGHGWNDGGIPAAAWIGYISNLRVVKGVAVYTSNFTPSTTPLTAVSGTVLLTCQNAAFTDNSSVNNALTPVSNATVTGNSPFNTVGYWSNYFNGDGNALSAPYNAAFAFPGNFTIECWINYSDHEAYAGIISSANPGVLSGGWQIIFNNTADTLLIEYTGGSFTTSTALTRNVWNHIAFVRSGSAMTLYINGVSAGTGTSSATFDSGSYPTRIGVERDVSHYITGYISNVRIVKGTAVYTGAFTPPTEPLTAISGTSLLTCQNGRFIDNSTNNFTITRTGNVSVQSFDPFYTSTIASNGGSMYFDGSGDYLYAPNNNALNIWDNGAGSFTVEAWIYATASIPNNVSIVGKASLNGSTPFDGWAFQVFSGVLNVNTASNNRLFSNSTAVPLNQWVHCVLVKSGSTVSIYQNGTRVGTTTNSNAYSNTVDQVHIAIDRNPAGSTFPGYISNLRMVKGTAVYDPSQATITVPTAPANPTPATTLMINGMNAGIYDATTINDLETVGNAQVRYPSPFAPANYWAGAFDGSGDYISVPASSSLTLGTGDFTIEMWLYSGANSTSTRLAGNGAGAGWGANKWVMGTGYAGSANKFFMSVNNGGTLLTSTTTFNDSVWHHAAVTRSGNTWRLFVDGVQEATLTSSVSVDGGIAANISIGSGQISGDADWAGSISNFRIVKGTAVYTSNFTPSTTPLTAISGTSLLTCQNKTFIDNSTNAFTITAFGNATAGAIGPFTATGGTSVYFDGSGDSGRIAVNQPALQFGTSNFTAEGWVCPTSTGVTNQHILTGGTSWTTGSGGIYIYSSGGVITLGAAWNQLPANPAVVSGALAPNTWYHFALVRNGNTLTLYINGTSVSTYNVSGYTLAFNNQSRTNIGGGGWDNDFGGYIDDLRVTNGVARYTSNFTPPTQPFPVY